MAKNDMKALFDRKADSSKILAEVEGKTEDGVSKDREINSWDDVFKGMFSIQSKGELKYELVSSPKKVTVMIQRELPMIHPDNIWGYDIKIPIMFTFSDIDGGRWWGYTYSIYNDTGWKFILFKPDEEALLEYIRGEIELSELYKTTDEYYLVTPNIDTRAVSVSYSELPQTAVPIEGSVYNDNIWFDTDDLFYGMNKINTNEVKEMARHNKFYAR